LKGAKEKDWLQGGIQYRREGAGEKIIRRKTSNIGKVRGKEEQAV